MSNDAETRKLVGRRGFLKGAATGAAAGAVSAAATLPGLAEARTQAETIGPGPGNVRIATTPAPNAAGLARETTATPPAAPAKLVVRPGSDLMVETLKRMGVEFVTSNNGSSFEALAFRAADHIAQFARANEI